MLQSPQNVGLLSYSRRRCANQVKRCYGADFFLTLLIEEYLQLSVFALSAYDRTRFTDVTWSALSLYELLTLVYLGLFLLLITYLILRLSMNPRIFKKTLHFFIFEGVRVVRGDLEAVNNNALSLPARCSRFYFAFFLLRRIIFACVLVFLRNSPKEQVALLMLLSILQILFLCLLKPLELKCRQILEVIDEIVFIGVLSILYVLRYHQLSKHQ